MKYEIRFTAQFKKDWKRAKKQGKNMEKLLAVIGIHSECNRDCFFNSNFPADFIAVL